GLIIFVSWRIHPRVQVSASYCMMDCMPTPMWLISMLMLVSLSPHALADAAPAGSSEADQLRGSYGPYRANNDLLYFHLDVRVDPEKTVISGKNTVRFRMLKDDKRIQLDLDS